LTAATAHASIKVLADLKATIEAMVTEKKMRDKYTKVRQNV